MRRFFRAILVGASETLLAVVVALGFFLTFLVMLNAAFPRGGGLNHLVRSKVADLGGERSILHTRGPGAGADDGSHETVAVLSRVTRQVKNRPANALAWSAASAGMFLEDRHTIQTLSRSGASITFDTESGLELEENSLVMIQRFDRRRRESRRAQAAVVVFGGKIRGRVAPANRRSGPLQILTADASTKILSRDEAPAEFAVTVRPDRSSTFSVFEGSAEVSAAGETALVRANQSVTVRPAMPPGKPVTLPVPPALLQPPDRFTQAHGAVAPSILFEWTGETDVTGYHFAIARDERFEEIVHETDLAGTRFVHGNLDAGRYYWRVSATRGGAEGASSPVRELGIVKDTEPPWLRVELPREIVAVESLTIRGTTEPGARVLLGSREVPISDDGEFEQTVELRRGPNLIVIQAIDAAGNTGYHSQYVNAKF